jgi:hypothetical protein
VLSDAQDAGAALGAGWAVAVFLAVVTAALNWVIYVVEFADGSDETHELDFLGRQLKPSERRLAALREQKAKIEEYLRR